MPRKPTCSCGECKKCKHRVYMRRRYEAMTPEERRAWVAKRDKTRVRAHDRKRSKEPGRLAYLTTNTKRWREQNPEKAKAQSKVAYAVKKGSLVKADECERKGCHKTKRLHAHHDDYSKPLEVRWLCALHHAEEKDPS